MFSRGQRVWWPVPAVGSRGRRVWGVVTGEVYSVGTDGTALVGQLSVSRRTLYTVIPDQDLYENPGDARKAAERATALEVLADDGPDARQ